MSEPLLVARNNGIHAVMIAAQFRWGYESPNLSDDGLVRRKNLSSIVTFAPRSRINDWCKRNDPRYLGISGSTEDLEAILKRYLWEERQFYVPFSNGETSAQNELLHHSASWDTFHLVFHPSDWTFKFGGLPGFTCYKTPHNQERSRQALINGVHIH